MEKKIWKSWASLAAASALVLSLGIAAMARTDQGDSPARGLQGTWAVTVNLQNCQTGANIGPPFYSYVTFADGGTLSESTSNPGFAIGQRGPELGIWSRERHYTYSAKSTAFIFYTTAPNLPTTPGFNAGTQTITQTIEYDEDTDSWTANAAISFADTTNTVYRQGCAVASGQRYQ
ncbi:MAG: hypothetical protein WCE61_15805 [Candidatus Acidiferrum sp.]